MSNKEKAAVKNVADRKQVNAAKITTKLGRDQELDDIRILLSTKPGRRFVWRLMSHCQLFSSPFNHSGSITSVQIGKGDVARWLLSEIVSTDENLWLQIQKENLTQGEINV